MIKLAQDLLEYINNSDREIMILSKNLEQIQVNTSFTRSFPKFSLSEISEAKKEILKKSESLFKDIWVIGEEACVVTAENYNNYLILSFNKLHNFNFEGLINDHVGYSLTNEDGVVLKVNDYFCKSSQYDRSELMGRTLEKLDSKMHDSRFYQEMSSRLSSKKIWRGIICNLNKSGNLYWTDSTVLAEEIDGKMFYHSIFKDVTKYQEEEFKVKEQNQILKLTLEGSGIGYWEYNPADPSRVFRNQAWYDQLGVLVMGNSQQDFVDRIHPEDKNLYLEKVQEQLSSNADKELELLIRVQHENGSYRQILTKGKVFQWDENHNPQKFAGVNIDVTEMMELKNKLVEQQVIASEKAKLATLGEMAGGIAHEINTPLTVILAKAKFILSVSNWEDPSEQDKVKKAAEKIGQTLNRIGGIVRNLRNFARDGSQDPMVDFNLTQMLQDSLDMCQEKLKHHNIEVSLECPENLKIQGQEITLSQIIVNLLNNAKDAIETQEDQKWIKVKVEELSSSVQISVIDSGLGIPKHIQEKLMQPFFTTKAVGKGTGLGLSISRGIVESHQGKFFIDNDCPNTCFKIVLPKSQEKQRKVFDSQDAVDNHVNFRQKLKSMNLSAGSLEKVLSEDNCLESFENWVVEIRPLVGNETDYFIMLNKSRLFNNEIQKLLTKTPQEQVMEITNDQSKYNTRSQELIDSINKLELTIKKVKNVA